jgi:hypothetical protein
MGFNWKRALAGAGIGGFLGPVGAIGGALIGGRTNMSSQPQQPSGPDPRQQYEQWAQNFDASSALNQYAQGAWGSISDALKQQLRAEAGSAVGQGRLNTGFYDEDRGTIYNRATQQMANALSQQSLNALNTTVGVKQDYGEQLQNDYREEQARKRQKKRGIGGLIGGALGAAGGFILGGGPAGAAAGWGVGSKVGSSF